MKSLVMVLLAAAGMLASARTITVQTQPVSLYLDTEVSTNVVLHGNRTDTRKLDMLIQLDETRRTRMVAKLEELLPLCERQK